MFLFSRARYSRIFDAPKVDIHKVDMDTLKVDQKASSTTTFRSQLAYLEVNAESQSVFNGGKGIYDGLVAP